MRGSRSIPRAGAVLALVAALAGRGGAAPAGDPLADAIARWQAVLAAGGSGELWTQVAQGSAPALAAAEQALAAGRRLFALQRLTAAQGNLAAARYVAALPAETLTEPARFEAEWARMGEELRSELAAPDPAALEGVRPAALRALGEAALARVRAHYGASLEYGRSTQPESGLFYVGAAAAQRDVARLCRELGQAVAPPAPALRSLAPELQALETQLLAAYRPPASIDAHPAFIRASGTLKEARELDAAGLRHAALLLYLQAAQRVAALRTPPAALAPEALGERLAGFEARLADPAADHSLGRLFLEAAQAEPESAATIAADVLPRYFAALAPAAVAAPASEAGATVTLVRWPYT